MVRYSSGTHPASGSFKDVTDGLGVDANGTPDPAKISSISLANLFSSASDEWMLLKEGETLRAIRSSGLPMALCHGDAKGSGPFELL